MQGRARTRPGLVTASPQTLVECRLVGIPGNVAAMISCRCCSRFSFGLSWGSLGAPNGSKLQGRLQTGVAQYHFVDMVPKPGGLSLTGLDVFPASKGICCTTSSSVPAPHRNGILSFGAFWRIPPPFELGTNGVSSHDVIHAIRAASSDCSFFPSSSTSSLPAAPSDSLASASATDILQLVGESLDSSSRFLDDF